MGLRASLSGGAVPALALAVIAAAQDAGDAGDGGAREAGARQDEPPGAPPEPAERPIWERIDLPSIAACGGCHTDVWREWSESLHALAWTNANVRNATRDFEIARCRPCHSPEPVLPKGLAHMPDYRDYNQADGVHCLSCHGLADGVAARRTVPDAPCRPRHEPRLFSADLCWPCHEPTHQAFEEYETSDAFAVGVRCADCHMPIVDRGERTGHSHGPHGGMNEAFVKKALGWTARVEDGAVHLELRNRTGHKFPGEIPSRSFVVRVDFGDDTSERVAMRKPSKGEDRADDRLRPDETRTLVFPLPGGVTSARVRLLFLPLPLLPESSAFVLGDWSSP